MSDEIGKGGERRPVNEFEYPFEYFDAQVQFAKKWAELMGIDFKDSLTKNTAVARRLAQGFRNKGWKQLLEDISLSPENASRMIYDRYMSLPQSKYVSPQSPTVKGSRFSFFDFDYYPGSPLNEGKNTVKVHFRNGARGEKSGLAIDFLHQRRTDLKSLFDFIKEDHPEAEEVVGGSWLYNLPAYRDSFPPEFTQNMKRLVPPGFKEQFPDAVPNMTLTGDSVWGQFVDRRGWARKQDYDAFLHNVSSARTPTDLVNAFPMQTLQPKAPIEVFHNWKPTP